MYAYPLLRDTREFCNPDFNEIAVSLMSQYSPEDLAVGNGRRFSEQYKAWWKDACDHLHSVGAEPWQIAYVLAEHCWPAPRTRAVPLSAAVWLPVPYTVDMIAQLLGVSRQTMYQWINGKAAPKLAHRRAIEDLLGPIIWPAACRQESDESAFIRENNLTEAFEAFRRSRQ